MKHSDEDEEAEFEVKHRGDWSQTVDPVWLCVLLVQEQNQQHRSEEHEQEGDRRRLVAPH